MSGRTDPGCTCQNTKNQPPHLKHIQMHDRMCFKCEQTFNIEMDDLHRRINCKQHKFIICCGYPPYICDTCAGKGWVGRGGDGGKDHADNTITNKTKWERKIDIELETKLNEGGPREPLF